MRDNSERRRLNLDRARLKAGSPDIGEVWSQQRKLFRSNQTEKPKSDGGIKKLFSNIFLKFKNLAGFTLDKIRNILRWTLQSKKLAALSIAVVLVFLGALSFITGSDTPKDVLGSNDSSTGLPDDGRTEEPLPFKALYPAGKTAESLSAVTRKTPSDQVIHTYRDTVSGVGIEVTQQSIPDDFNDEKLEKVADEFNAKSVIQIDGKNVYHGLNEKGGNQVLIFTKDDSLIFINSSKKLKDEAWVGYITSLKS